MRILHTNDLHGMLNQEVEERLLVLRQQADIYLDSGDAVAFGNLAIPLKQDPVWERFARLSLTAQVPGNREYHVMESVFTRKVEGAIHPMLAANLFRTSGELLLPPSLIITVGDQRVGIVGVMLLATRRGENAIPGVNLYQTDPVEAALVEGTRLRPEVDTLFALTHIGRGHDLKLAKAGLFDIIFGGHSHSKVPPERVGHSYVTQDGSHGQYATLYDWDASGFSYNSFPLRGDHSPAPIAGE